MARGLADAAGLPSGARRTRCRGPRPRRCAASWAGAGPIGILENGSSAASRATDGPGTPGASSSSVGWCPHKRVDAVVRAVVDLATRCRTSTWTSSGGVRSARPSRAGRAARRGGRWSPSTATSRTRTWTTVLGGCGFHVCASDVEGWGQVVIDAAAHGIPTIGRDVPGLRDSIVEGSTGWLVAPAAATSRWPSPRRCGCGRRSTCCRSGDAGGVRRALPCVGRAIHLGPDARRGRRGDRGGPRRASLPVSTTRSVTHWREPRPSTAVLAATLTLGLRRQAREEGEETHYATYSGARSGGRRLLSHRGRAHGPVLRLPQARRGAREPEQRDQAPGRGRHLLQHRHPDGGADRPRPSRTRPWATPRPPRRPATTSASGTARPRSARRTAPSSPAARSASRSAPPTAPRSTAATPTPRPPRATARRPTARARSYKFPFNTQQQTYQWWDGTLGEPVEMKFVEEDEVDGLKAYMFESSVPRTEVGEREVPGSILGEDDDVVMAETLVRQRQEAVGGAGDRCGHRPQRAHRDDPRRRRRGPRHGHRRQPRVHRRDGRRQRRRPQRQGPACSAWRGPPLPIVAGILGVVLLASASCSWPPPLRAGDRRAEQTA